MKSMSRILVRTWPLILVVALMGAMAARAQAPDAEAAADRAAQSRLEDIDTIVALTSEGAILYAQDEVKLSGYQYCSQAVALAEAGEFRQSIRAASKALHLANAGNDENLKALANRDLAIAYGYAGQLDKSIEFAREALRHTPRDPQIVYAPAHKIIGDARMRRSDYAGAVLSYEEALTHSSPRYAPLVQASLTNALIETGELQRARELLGKIPNQRDAGLQAQLDRTHARLLLAEKKPEQALAAYRKLTERTYGVESRYFQLWAWDGVARTEQALGRPAEATQAIDRALTDIDQVRSKFRSEEIKIGLFSDLQSVFERGLVLHGEQGNEARAFEISERSRSRALLDAVRGRADLDAGAARTLGLPALQASLRPNERVVQFHALPTHLQVWVIGPDSIQGHRVAVARDDLAELVEVFRNSVVRGRRTAVGNADKLGRH